MARLLRHRQTKWAETDKPNLLLPRHISTLPEVRVRHVATKLSFAETAGVADGGFVAPEGTQPIGQVPTVAIPPGKSFKGRVDSKTCRTIYGRWLASLGLPA